MKGEKKEKTNTALDDAVSVVPVALEPVPVSHAYDEDTKKAALTRVLEQGKSITLAAREMGIHRDTVSAWLREVEESTQTDARALDVRLARLLGQKINELLGALDKDKLAKASPRDISIAAGILFDKRRDILGPRKNDDSINLKIAWKDGSGAVELSTSPRRKRRQ